MVEWRALATLLLMSTIVMGSPGPATMSVTAVGAAFGLQRSLPYVGGVIVGTTTVLLAVATGVFAVLLSVPRIGPVLLAGSAIYILYLAFRIATAPPLSKTDAVGVVPSFAGGFALAVANPKAYVAIAAVFAGATLTSGSLDAVLKTAVLAIMIVVIHVAWLIAGAALSRMLHDPLRARIVNVTFAAVLVVTTALAVV